MYGVVINPTTELATAYDRYINLFSEGNGIGVNIDKGVDG